MIAWTRAARFQMCGRCGAQLAPGDPIQVISLQAMRRRLLRCGDCAAGEVPPDLPPDIHVKPSTTKAFRTTVGQLAAQFQRDELPKRLHPPLRQLVERHDPKMRQVGEDD